MSSVEDSLGRIADSLRQMESEADLSTTVNLAGTEELLSSIQMALESIDTHLVEIVNSIPVLAKIIATGMPALVKALTKN